MGRSRPDPGGDVASRPSGGGPLACGIGLRAPHVETIAVERPALAWVEIHAENYMGGGRALARLDAIRRDAPVSVHGVGLSLGTDGPLDAAHVARLRALIDRVEPFLVSEHLSWSTVGGAYLNHLLPLPYTEETLAVVADRVARVQQVIGRALLVENPSSYLRFRHSTIPEAEFLAALVARTGCGLLCDVNNVFVSAHNVGLDARAYLDALPAHAVGEIHIAGHAANDADGRVVLIDDHSSRVADPVWALYERAVRRFPAAPALVEWDTDVPALDVLIGEASIADARRAAALEIAHADAR